MEAGRDCRHAAQGLLEFALVLPLFLTMVFAIIEFSWAIFGYSIVQSAANEGVRRAMVLNRPASNYGLPQNMSGGAQPLTGCDTKTILGTVACSVLTLSASRITVDVNVPNPANYVSGQNVPAGHTVSVIVHYLYAPLVAYAFDFGTGYTMTGFATAQTQ